MRRLLLLLLLLLAAWLPAQSRRPLKIVFYNVENLFDTADNPAVRDDDFTPRGAMRWTEARCTDKLRRLARVLADIDDAEGGPAAVIGLAETETPEISRRLARCLAGFLAADTLPTAGNPAVTRSLSACTPPAAVPSLTARPAASGLPAGHFAATRAPHAFFAAGNAASPLSAADPPPAAALPLLAADTLPSAAGNPAATRSRSACTPPAAAPSLTADALPTAGTYAVVHEQSADPRGIDVALLYRTDLFELQGHRTEPLDPAAPSLRTRDLLTVWGLLRGMPCFFLVAHLPSRRGGEAAAALRLTAGRRIRAIVDSIRRTDPLRGIVIMGDLNDDPIDPSVTEGLGARGKAPGPGEEGLYNPFFALYRAGRGTLVYDRTWQLFDQIIVGNNLLGTGSPEETTDMAGTAGTRGTSAAAGPVAPTPRAIPAARPAAPDTSGTPPAQAAAAPASPAETPASSLRLVADPATGFHGTIFAPAYLLHTDGPYRGCPFRTYAGKRYLGGYSDHLPVYVRLE